MYCGDEECGGLIADEDQLFFYYQSDVDVHLCVKPECILLIDAGKNSKILYREVQNEEWVFCTACDSRGVQHKLGKRLPYGPADFAFCAFGRERVVVLGMEPTRDFNRKWKRCFNQPPFDRLPIRTNQNFFEMQTTSKKTSEHAHLHVKFPSIIFPDKNNLEHFRWDNLVEGKVPRDYQIKGFIEGLLRDVVVVQGTGSGKTLIAAMIMRRLRELNPDLLPVFVVDRVPLTYQQANAIQEDTNLVACTLCGESKTNSMLRDLVEGQFDCLVTTAGCLKEQVQSGGLSMKFLSCLILDECHHCNVYNEKRNHDYNKLLNFWRELPEGERPRLVGLSASPVPVPNLFKGEQFIRNFSLHFGRAAVFAPRIALTEQDVKWVTLKPEFSLGEFQKELLKVYRSLQSKIRIFLDLRYQVYVDIFDPRNIAAAKFHLKKLIDQNFRNKNLAEFLEKQRALLDLAELARVTSVAIAAEHIMKEMPDFAKLFKRFTNDSYSSPRILKLITTLKSIQKDSRALVFVETRLIARKLTEVLRKEIPQFNPMVMVGQKG